MIDDVPDCPKGARRYSRMLVHQALFDVGKRFLSEGRHGGQVDSDEAKTNRVAFQLLKLSLLCQQRSHDVQRRILVRCQIGILQPTLSSFENFRAVQDWLARRVGREVRQDPKRVIWKLTQFATVVSSQLPEYFAGLLSVIGVESYSLENRRQGLDNVFLREIAHHGFRPLNRV